MKPQPYPSDLSDEEWSILAPLLVPGRQAGRPRVFEPRRIADAAFYLLRTGCQWRAAARLPALADRLLPLRPMAALRHLGADQRRAARAAPRGDRPRSPALGGYHRQPVRAHDRGRRAAPLRPRPKDFRPQAP